MQRIGSTHHIAKEDKPKKRFIIPVAIAAAVIILIIGGLLVWSKSKGEASGIDSSKYQAVFFTNGQVYFGKLTSLNDNYMKMTDIFYLQTQGQAESDDKKNPQDIAADQSNVQLIKLGNEVHGPEDEMIISRDQVLFYENLKADGKVATTIKQYKEK
ncbi:hypothetical protein EYC58_02325 [Candidatus Saccharibacteria bacterium]|nr:MAG: hypothetical protein EYC58_02325 [Candidatus Saccharibacteria bacterium]